MNDTTSGSEVMFRLLTEAAPYAIALADRQGHIVFVNSRMEKLFGYNEEELIGQSIEILVPERFRARHAEYRRAYHDAPEIRPMGSGRDLYGLRKDGREFSIEIGLSPVETPGGLLFMTSIADISQRKQAEEALKQSEARLRLAFSAAHAGTWDWDIPANQLMWSEESYFLIGLDPGQDKASAENWLNRVHPEDRDWVMEAVSVMIDRQMSQRTVGDELDLEYRVLLPGGRIRWVNDRGQVLYDASHRPVRMIGIMIDITERKAAEEKLAAQARELARSNEELQAFAYVASHDLQEPLRAVSGCVEILKRRYHGQLDARADELITHAVDGAARMQNLINDLLAYSRVSSRGRASELTDSRTALSSAMANLQVAIQESGAVVAHDDLPKVFADPAQLTLLFQNLIGNAIKFRGERAPTIHIGVRRQKDEWRFSVRDNGIGIDPQFFGRIFNIFQRLHGRREYPGTGIGLAICKSIVERHGGRIWVESRPGEGATFYFTIPLHTNIMSHDESH